MKIALVDCKGFDIHPSDAAYDYGRNSLALVTLYQLISQTNRHEVLYVPSNQTIDFDSQSLIDEATRELRRMKPDVIFMSVYSAHANLALNLAEKWKSETGSRIVMGGKLFGERDLLSRPSADEAYPVFSPIRQPISTLLLCSNGQNIVDYAYSGDGANIDALLKILEGKKPERSEGIFSIENNTLYGYGRSGNILADQLPVSESRGIGKNDDIFRVSISDKCPNVCHYCFRPSGASYDPESAGRILANRVAEGSYLSFSDSNPIRKNSLNIYETMLSEIRKHKRFVSAGLFLDPAELIEPEFREEAISFIKNEDVFSILVGRDCVTEEIASKVGRLHRGKPRTQEMLNAETEVIYDLIRKTGYPEIIQINYIFTPFENLASIDRITREAIVFAEQASKSKTNVRFTLFPLAPFPGSELAHSSEHYADSLALFGNPDGWFWDNRLEHSYRMMSDFFSKANFALTGRRAVRENKPVIENKALAEVVQEITEKGVLLRRSPGVR